MECPNCKTENRDGVRFCGACGQPLSNSATLSSAYPRSLVTGTPLQGGRYVVKKVLGQGGMGAALLATDVRLDGKLVVIKELVFEHNDVDRQQDEVRNFKREVVLLAHLMHPLIPAVTDHFQEDSRYFMVQDYVEGENLEERLARYQQPLKEREVLICATEILDVLEYLAERTPPIVHRDIKPANIIIGARDRRAHLVDFGIARASSMQSTPHKQTSALGTPGYAPPEQYQGNADPRSDLYGLAATLHHMLTNRDPRNHPPFSYPPARTLNPQVSPETEQLLIRALLNDSNQRYQSATGYRGDSAQSLRYLWQFEFVSDRGFWSDACTGRSGDDHSVYDADTDRHVSQSPEYAIDASATSANIAAADRNDTDADVSAAELSELRLLSATSAAGHAASCTGSTTAAALAMENGIHCAAGARRDRRGHLCRDQHLFP
jgi:eukaryotic-like serine/threonine-protein kinase